MQGEARLRGLDRVIYSKTIISVYFQGCGCLCPCAQWKPGVPGTSFKRL